MRSDPLRAAMLAGLATSPEDRAEAKAMTERRDAARKQAVDEIAHQLLGVLPGDGDACYTAQPLMAGVIRRALIETYDRAASEAAQGILREVMEHVAKRPPEQPEP